ncbi:hypothetical protein SUGI_0217690 [Cryptomeria japonica]|nr:hypothetical protein SUGI_0217690 [Cryptomeria japonica]
MVSPTPSQNVTVAPAALLNQVAATGVPTVAPTEFDAATGVFASMHEAVVSAIALHGGSLGYHPPYAPLAVSGSRVDDDGPVRAVAGAGVPPGPFSTAELLGYGLSSRIYIVG